MWSNYVRSNIITATMPYIIQIFNTRNFYGTFTTNIHGEKSLWKYLRFIIGDILWTFIVSIIFTVDISSIMFEKSGCDVIFVVITGVVKRCLVEPITVSCSRRTRITLQLLFIRLPLRIRANIGWMAISTGSSH